MRVAPLPASPPLENALGNGLRRLAVACREPPLQVLRVFVGKFSSFCVAFITVFPTSFGLSSGAEFCELLGEDDRHGS